MSLNYTTIVVDENVPRQVVEHLKTMGFKHVLWIAETRGGQSDPEVWQYAAGKQALLVTGDRGFAPQLSTTQIMNGPKVVCFSTKGIRNNELQDPEVMRMVLDWLFRHNHHNIDEWHTIQVQGDCCTRRNMAQQAEAKARRGGARR